ncbi:hypothetical protein WR25_07501 [Diploscapter pachys]|uniref:Uncharacterized protein n=1 Tax=Diploscapter pachys TaxID=2018661 RepID=A0A2A2JK03_9BILA|nr:hypothetical protein WR25_07501 [Diploscapter pachys]
MLAGQQTSKAATAEEREDALAARHTQPTHTREEARGETGKRGVNNELKGGSHGRVEGGKRRAAEWLVGWWCYCSGCSLAAAGIAELSSHFGG